MHDASLAPGTEVVGQSFRTPHGGAIPSEPFETRVVGLRLRSAADPDTPLPGKGRDRLLDANP